MRVCAWEKKKKKEKTEQIMDSSMLTSLQPCHTPVTNSFWQRKAILLNWLGATKVCVRAYGSLSQKLQIIHAWQPKKKKSNTVAKQRYLKSIAISFKLRVLAFLFISASSGTSKMCFFEYTQIRFLEKI